MPYTKETLPAAVKKLPSKAQDIWLAAYNAAAKEYKGDEAKSFGTAWAAVKKKYEQAKDGTWKLKKGRSMAAEEHASLPMLTRAVAAFTPGTFDAENRTVELTWTTGATVRRSGFFGPGWDEELLMGDENVDLSRLNAGAPLLNSHAAYDLRGLLGVVEDGSARLLGPKGQRKGRATVRFSDRPDVEPIMRDVANGIIRNVSAGYSVQEWERINPPPQAEGKDAIPLMRAKRWTPLEISLVPIAADAGAQVRAGGDQHPCVIRSMEDESVTAAAASGAAQEAAESKTTEKTETEDKVEVKETEKQEEAGKGTAGGQKQEGGEGEGQRAGATGFGEGRQGGVRPGQGAEATSLTPAECAIIARTASSLGLPSEFAVGLMGRDGMSLARARELIIDEKAKRQEGTQVSGVHIAITRDECATRAGAIRDALLHSRFPERFPMPSDSPARQFMGFRLMELARHELEAAGIRTAGLPPMEIARLALIPGYGVRQPGFMGIRSELGLHTTSDFPSALLDVVYKSARQSYALAPQTFKEWARQATHKDYRLVNSIQLSNLGTLSQINEHGEYVYGTLSDSKEAYRVQKYGKIVGITREVIVNDDLGLFTDIPARMGVAARNTESDVVYAVLLANAAMGADGTALFHANHGNLAASGLAISVASVASGFSAMSVQKDPDGQTFLNVMPRFLLVPPLLWGIAAQLTGQIQPNAITGVVPNPIQGLRPVVEPRLQGGVTVNGVTYSGSSTAWYLAADPGQVPTVEYAYLEGQEGVYTETQPGFEIDGLKVKVRLDFGAKALDWRGMYQQPGA